MTEEPEPGLEGIRRRAEARLGRFSPAYQAAEPDRLLRILHELQVHQVELEIQNEELREARLEEDSLRQRYVDFYDFSPSGFVSLGPDGGILQINLTGARMLGQERYLLVGQRLGAWVAQPDRSGLEAFLAGIFSGGAAGACKMHLVRKDGSVFPVHLEGMPTADGMECRAVIVDISDLERSQEERRLLEADLLQAHKMESLGVFAGGIAHDMNNVMGAILGLATTLCEAQDLPPTHARNLKTIVAACLRGRDVVRSLMAFAHKGPREERPVDLRLLVEDLARLMDSFTMKRIQVQVEVQPNLPLVRGEAGALSHALLNLCVNSMDAMAQGGELLILGRQRPDGDLELRVVDTGPGMDSTVLARAMEPFFTTKSNGTGTGLGLSMVNGTMKAHGGRMELRSSPGMGTEAILTFPAERLVPWAPIPSIGPGTQRLEPSSLDILLVDDDPLILDAMSLLLGALGHRALTASTGHQALQFLATDRPFSLVILDMHMPDMTGAQVLPLLRGYRPTVPVLLCTGYNDESLLALVEATAGVHSISKPFTLGELRTRLADLPGL